MKEAFKKTVISVICSSVIAFIIGLVMVLNPGLSIKTIGLIAAIYMIVHGVILIVLDVKASKYYIPFDGIMSGLLSIILGIILVAMPGVFATVFTIALGVWVILSSINIMKMAIAVKDVYSKWILLLILGILDLIAGIIVLFNPFEISLSLVVFAGLVIMVHSVISIVDMIIVVKDVKDITKAIESKLNELNK